MGMDDQMEHRRGNRVSAGGLLFLVAPESLQGLVQRWIYFVSLSWLVAIAIMALRTTGRGQLRTSSPR